MFCLEWRFVALDGHSDFYVELSLFNSGRVTAKNYNFPVRNVVAARLCFHWRL